MKRSAGSSRLLSKNEAHLPGRKTQQTLSSKKLKTSFIKDNESTLQKFSSYENKHSLQSNFRTPKIGSPKDTLDDITNLSLETSLSLASLKNYDYKIKNGISSLFILNF